MFAPHTIRPLALAPLAFVGLIALAGLPAASAHEGPPFPILMDQPLAGYSVSVWADPDIGDAQFFIVVESAAGGPPQQVPSVAMWVEPVSGRLDPVNYETKRQSLRNQMQFEAKPYFDQRDMWTVGIRVTHPRGQSQALTTEVESTPPGYGPWDLAIYLFPFLLLGGLWVWAMVRRRGTMARRDGRQQKRHSPSPGLGAGREEGFPIRTDEIA